MLKIIDVFSKRVFISVKPLSKPYGVESETIPLLPEPPKEKNSNRPELQKDQETFRPRCAGTIHTIIQRDNHVSN